MRKSVLLLTCSTFALASVTATLPPPAAADEGIAGAFYYSIPLGGSTAAATDPIYGFRMSRQVERDVVFAPDALTGAGDPLKLGMLDFQFTDQGPTALRFGGIDALPIVAGPLGFHGGAGTSQEQEDQEHLWIYGGGAVVLGLAICAIAGCFDSDGGDGGESSPCWVARAVYGEHDLRWRLFRNWLLADAPGWFRALYLAQGPRFAAWIADKPGVKRTIRAWMDSRIERAQRA